MKKIFLLILTIGLFFGSLVFAQDLGHSKLTTIASKAKISQATLESRVGGIIAAVLGMLGTLFLVLTIYAGVLWMTASGEEGKIEKAKDILKAAIIGLAIVLSAYTITYFVGSKLGGASPTSESCNCFQQDQIDACEEIGGYFGDATKANCQEGEFACCVK